MERLEPPWRVVPALLSDWAPRVSVTPLQLMVAGSLFWVALWSSTKTTSTLAPVVTVTGVVATVPLDSVIFVPPSCKTIPFCA